MIVGGSRDRIDLRFRLPANQSASGSLQRGARFSADGRLTYCNPESLYLIFRTPDNNCFVLDSGKFKATFEPSPENIKSEKRSCNEIY